MLGFPFIFTKRCKKKTFTNVGEPSSTTPRTWRAASATAHKNNVLSLSVMTTTSSTRIPYNQIFYVYISQSKAHTRNRKTTEENGGGEREHATSKATTSKRKDVASVGRSWSSCMVGVFQSSWPLAFLRGGQESLAVFGHQPVTNRIVFHPPKKCV